MKIGKMWNEKFSRDGYLYGKEPNAYLKEVIDALTPGSRILFLGEGEGRNACYAAANGFEAHAIDASDVGLEKLQQMAEEREVCVATMHLDLADWQPEETYDAILCSYLHLEEPLRTMVFVKALSALSENGVFAGEFFSLSQLQRDSGGPKDETLLYGLGSFEKLKRPWIVCERLEACTVELDEGKGHRGPAEVIRVLLRHRKHPKYKITLPRLTLDALFERSVAHYGSRIAFRTIDGSIELTYEAFAQKVFDLQARLNEAGIGRGDKVALCSENMPNWGVVYFAVTTMGAVIVPILPDFHDNEVRRIIAHAECSAAFLSKKKRDVLDDENVQDLSLVYLTDDLSEDEAFEKGERSMLEKGADAVNRIREGVKGLRSVKTVLEACEDDLAAIIYTSGTTGSSKGVMLTHRALAFESLISQSVTEVFPEDRFLSILPMAHTYECSIGFLVPFANGASVTYLSKAPTPKILTDALASVKPNCMLSVPLVIEKIFKSRVLSTFHKNAFIRTLYGVGFIRKFLHRAAGRKLMEIFGGELRFFGIGGAPLSPMVETFLSEAGFPYCVGYGLTETAPLLAGSSPDIVKPRAIGPVLDSIEARIANANEKGEGTIMVKGPNVMTGYYKDPEKTAEVLDGEGWFNTEDLGYVDAEGYLYISGRSKNVILGPSGENIYPEQIEAIITENEVVEDALVYDVDKQLVARVHFNYEKLDEVFGIKRFSETQVHHEIEALLERIRTETNENVSKFSRVSRMIEQREPFVKTPTKKIKRYLYTDEG